MSTLVFATPSPAAAPGRPQQGPTLSEGRSTYPAIGVQP
jgi:hypothetical protein